MLAAASMAKSAFFFFYEKERIQLFMALLLRIFSVVELVDIYKGVGW